jgi:hypothetical protein
MALLTGIVLAFVIGVFARVVGLDRERAFYTTVLIVIACLYALFAAIGGSREVMLQESIGIAGFTVLAVLGFKKSEWFLVVGLVGHGVYDFFHGHLIANAGVPDFWPAFCGGYDVLAGLFLAVLILFRKGREK